ncbi:peptidase inhibitor family I36 protein [Streptomyces sp. NPDC059477]|uniref:peptidase inhibitor family I36 protein n=1 Tax=Streptomyces sp. NPDC059477 TaxID=3346847 RepID=UPI0036C28CEC
MALRSSLVTLATLATAGLMGAALAIAPAAQAQQAAPDSGRTLVAVPASSEALSYEVFPSGEVSLGAGQAAGFGATPGDVGTLKYSDCPSGYICFWSEPGGEGLRCSWSAALNPRAREACSWMNNGTTTKSVYNRTSYRYHYYRAFNYQDRIGSTLSGGQGNLAGTYTIGSLCRHNASGCPN